MSQDTLNIHEGAKTIEVTPEQLWAELRSLGVDQAVRELVNREARSHTAIVERIVTAAGFKRNPGLDALCAALKNRRQAGMTVATLAEGLSGEVVALRRVLANASGLASHEGRNTVESLKTLIDRIAAELGGSRKVVNSADLDSVSHRIDRYRRLGGSSVVASEVKP